MPTRTKKTKHEGKRPVPYPIPEEYANQFRQRKVEKGVNICRSIADAIAFALSPANREQWW